MGSRKENLNQEKKEEEKKEEEEMKKKKSDNTNRKDDTIPTTPPSSATAASAAGAPMNQLLEALTLRPTVSPLLHDALGRARVGICHGDGTDACPGIHEVDNLIFTAMTKNKSRLSGATAYGCDHSSSHPP